MKAPYPHQSSEFCLEGHFLGFIREGSKFKYLRLEIANAELKIKLSKQSRASCSAVLKPNDWLQVTGEMSVSLNTGELKLKATQITNLNACAICRDSTDAESILSIVSMQTPAIAPAGSGVSANPKLKLLMCQKSGCQKKGGKKHRQAIETLLRDRNLLDQVVIQETGCLGKCSLAPNLVLMPGKRRVSGMSPNAIVALLTTLSP